MKQEKFNKALFDLTTLEGQRLKNVALKVANMYLNKGVIDESFYDQIKAENNFSSLRGYKEEKNMYDLKPDYFDPRRYNVFDAQTDVPSWIVTENTKPTIMVIAQDALRSKKDKIVFKSITLLINTPFSLQGLEDREIKSGTLASYSFLFSEIAEIGNVYITDVYKMFFNSKDGVSKKEFKKGKEKNQNVTILQKEINELNPDFIIAMGSNSFNILQYSTKEPNVKITASNTIVNYQDGEKLIPVFGMIHPAAYDNHKRLFIEENKKTADLNAHSSLEVITKIVCGKISSVLS